MYVIKLNATPSTNDYLKDLVQSQKLKDFTIVQTYNQTNGKGQMGSKWISEKHKTLTFSFLIHTKKWTQDFIFGLNTWVSVAFIRTLHTYNFNKTAIKWPNDILAGNKKIAGILIENILKPSGACDSIIGIGCNILGTQPKTLAQSGTIFSEYGVKIEIDEFRDALIKQLKLSYQEFPDNLNILWQEYHRYLFKKNIVSTFELPNKELVVGKIIEVNTHGKLKILFDDDEIEYFGIKEIKMKY